MARIIIKIEIEPDPDGKHCGDCHLVERGGWCSAFDRRLDGILGRWDCCPECLAARAPGKHTSQVLNSLWTAVRCAQQRLADLDAMDLDEREDHHHVEVVRLQQTMELHETAAAETEIDTQSEACEELADAINYAAIARMHGAWTWRWRLAGWLVGVAWRVMR